MGGPVDRRLTGTLLMAGAVLGIGSNVGHPIVAPDASPEAFLRDAVSSPVWLPVHLVLTLAIVVSTVAFVLLAALLVDTAGRTWAVVAGALAVVSGTIFAAQVGAVDGIVMPSLATQLADGGGDAVVVSATAWVALDYAMLSLSVALYLGATWLAVGAAMLRAGAFAPWVRWAALAIGSAGLLNGVLMFLGVADVVTLYAFRVIGLASTVLGLALGLRLHREDPLPARRSPTVAGRSAG